MSVEPTEKCSQCGEPEVLSKLNADFECQVCAALMSLKATLERMGRIHRELPLEEPAHSQLPPSDR